MTLFQNKYRIESARLKEWDYKNPWWYYVTINTKNHFPWFGKVERGKMKLNRLGKLVENIWNEITIHYTNTELDYFVVMPNHLHGIIIFDSNVEPGPRLRRVNMPGFTTAHNNWYLAPKFLFEYCQK